MVVKTQDVRTPCYSDIYNIINNYTNTYYLYTLLFAKLYAENVINKAFHKHGVASFTGAWIETKNEAISYLYSKSHPLRMRHVPFSERSNHHRFNLLSEFVSLLRITILSIIINKIQTTTKRKCHYSSIDCSYVIYLY